MEYDHRRNRQRDIYYYVKRRQQIHESLLGIQKKSPEASNSGEEVTFNTSQTGTIQNAASVNISSTTSGKTESPAVPSEGNTTGTVTTPVNQNTNQQDVNQQNLATGNPGPYD